MALNRSFSDLSQRLLRRRSIEICSLALRIVLIIVCFILVGWTVRRCMTDYLARGEAVTLLENDIETKLSTISKAAAERADRLEYSEITKANIFNHSKIQPTPPPIAASTPVPVSKASLALIGTFVTPGEPPYAIIEDQKKRLQEIFNIGDSIFDEAKLKAIHADRVEIDRNGTVEILLMDESDSGGSGGGSGSGDDIVVDEAELDKALENLPLLLTQARAVPYFKDGKSIGLRLFAIKRGSLFEKIGLANGDILKAINGNSLADITQAVKLFERLKEERSITVDLERNRQEKSLKYQIR